MAERAPEPFGPGLADLLEDAVADIFDSYERQSTVQGGPRMKDERTRTQSLKRARAILEDTIEELRTPTLATGHRGVGGVLARALCAVADSYAGMLLNQVHEAHAAERRRLSRELHDRIGYGISVAQRSLELHDVYRDGDPGRAAVRMHTAQQMLGDTIGVVRQIISDLRLVEPVENLEKAIKLFLERAAGPRLSGHVEVNGDEVWASPDVVEEVYLILREALRNVVAHADAASVLVRVDVARGELRACVVDDGCGFDVAAIPHDGTGVLSMRERAALLGATLTLRSRAGRGTRLELLVPLAEDGGTWATR